MGSVDSVESPLVSMNLELRVSDSLQVIRAICTCQFADRAMGESDKWFRVYEVHKYTIWDDIKVELRVAVKVLILS
jgi:hypothetical protein